MVRPYLVPHDSPLLGRPSVTRSEVVVSWDTLAKSSQMSFALDSRFHLDDSSCLQKKVGPTPSDRKETNLGRNRGIGGSYLGVEFVHEALRNLDGKVFFMFFSHSERDDVLPCTACWKRQHNIAISTINFVTLRMPSCISHFNGK